MQNNTKDRLINLIQNAVSGCARNWAEVIADHLLANGVVVPPCKIGQTVWFVENDFSVGECKVSGLTQKADETWKIRLTHLRCKCVFEIKPDAIGKEVFFTKEEADRALKEMTEGEE